MLAIFSCTYLYGLFWYPPGKSEVTFLMWFLPPLTLGGSADLGCSLRWERSSWLYLRLKGVVVMVGGLTSVGRSTGLELQVSSGGLTGERV